MQEREIQKIDCDVLIVGGGAASCVAALEASKYGLRVILVDKGFLGRSGSNPTSGGWGVAAAFGHFDIETRSRVEKDNPDVHFTDTLRSGEFINDQKIVRVVVDEILDRVSETEHLGVHYAKSPDAKFYLQRGGWGHSYARLCFGGAGWELMEVFAKEIFYRRVRVMENIMLTRVFARQGAITGAFGVETKEGRYFLFQCPAMILGAGSATGLYHYSSASYRTTGDAYAMVADLGLSFGNMEFVEFTLIPAPGGKAISTSGISPFIGRGAKFYNNAGESFMMRYDPERGERTTRAKLVQGVYLEMRDGRGPCMMDATEVNWDEFLAHEPHVMEKLGGLVDPRKERFEWVPAVHSFLGGVKIDEKGQTDIQGLFASSESATGMHGANRLGGNALAACYVLGRRAGMYACQYAIQNKASKVTSRDIKQETNRIRSLYHPKGRDPFQVEKEVQRVAWQRLGVVRNAKDLEGAKNDLNTLQSVRFKIGNVGDLIKSLEVRNLALTGWMVASAALVRNESRGHHMREDFPKKDGLAWRKALYLKKENEP
jgi:fumarate reductase (CoM/CoB) subunit A